MSTAERPHVRGAVIDDETRCAHYAGPRDIVAMRFFCCDEWYPCLHCHDEAVGHVIRPWPAERRDAHAVLCGACGRTMRIDEYLPAVACPGCAAEFNPGCALHHHVYFEL